MGDDENRQHRGQNKRLENEKDLRCALADDFALLSNLAKVNLMLLAEAKYNVANDAHLAIVAVTNTADQKLELLFV